MATYTQPQQWKKEKLKGQEESVREIRSSSLVLDLQDGKLYDRRPLLVRQSSVRLNTTLHYHLSSHKHTI